MDEEIANLNHFGCFQKVPRSEALKHGRLVKSKWVFKVKYNDDNTVQRFRARLVAKGFTQVPGSDFYETYSPVFSYTSLRTIFAVAAERNLPAAGSVGSKEFIHSAEIGRRAYVYGVPRRVPQDDGGRRTCGHALPPVDLWAEAKFKATSSEVIEISQSEWFQAACLRSVRLHQGHRQRSSHRLLLGR